jgi:hypothetical protein
MTVHIKAPYQSIQQENVRLIEKYKLKINQEARKDIVLSQVANPKVSGIQNKNEEYLNQKV